MLLKSGQVLRGKLGTYRLAEALKPPAVFKAVVTAGEFSKAKFVVVKTEVDPDQDYLRRERHNYMLNAIKSSKYFRSLLDIISPFESDAVFHIQNDSKSPFCMVFEWMDNDLWRTPSYKHRSDSNLPRTIAGSVLSALNILRDLRAVHTDINPNNIFLSNIESSTPTVKLGDLGCTIPEGFDAIRVQSYETRAPEVWRGLGCWHTSDVWSLGVTLAHWLHASTIFGPNDKIIEGLTNEWCIAKMTRLVGPVDDSPTDSQQYAEEFDIARELIDINFVHPETGLEQRLISNESLRTILTNSPGPEIAPDLLDFIDYLLVPDHSKRPTAAEALKHPYLAGFSG